MNEWESVALPSNWIWIQVFLKHLLWFEFTANGVPGLEIHFEHRDGGFFIRPPSRGSNSSPSGQPTSTASFSAEQRSEYPEAEDTIQGTDGSGTKTSHFTLLPSSQPVSIRVTYGPFSTKQTVPVRLLVPDPIEADFSNGTTMSDTPLDLSAHLVTPTVPKDTPILRVLFHAGQTAFGLPVSVLTSHNGPRGLRQQQVVLSFLVLSLFFMKSKILIFMGSILSLSLVIDSAPSHQLVHNL